MKGRILFALPALALALACQNPEQPSSVRHVPVGPSKIISDGSHVGGNPDFFFLPPLVPLPFGNATFRANFELGKFNNALGPALQIKICDLGTALPTEFSTCGADVMTFDFRSGLHVVNIPLRERGWWSLMGLPADGFYYALWDTRQPGLPALDNTKYYRIRVFLGTDQLGYADVDPMPNLREWRYSQTGTLIQLVNGWLLPIPFRVEKNGSPCATNAACIQQTVDNTGGLVQVPGGAGPLAGAEFPPDWLPKGPGLPDHVLVTISRVNTGQNEDGTQTIPCHRNLPLQQFYSCFKFTTYPKLGLNSTAFPGHQFQAPVRTAVCYRRFNTEDPRSEWVQLWASDDGANFRSLPEATDEGILSPNSQNCYNPPNGYGNNSTGFRGLASAGWRKLKGGLGQIFGVQTAYAVDLGIGGTILDFSNISPALTARIDNWGSFGEGLSQTAIVKITGITHHHSYELGINDLPVTFTVDAASGNFGRDEGGPITQVVVPTSSLGDGGDGFASVDWTATDTPGPHTMTANGPAFGGPITFKITVPSPPPPIP